MAARTDTLFGETVGKLRNAWFGLARIILTPETSKHRIFVYSDNNLIPDHKLYVICLDDIFYLGCLSSRVHRVWALSAGGTLEDRPTWTNTTCFIPFPFPDNSNMPATTIRERAMSLCTHRNERTIKHINLTLTKIYNVIQKLRDGEPFTIKDKQVHKQGLCSVLLQLQ